MSEQHKLGFFTECTTDGCRRKVRKAHPRCYTHELEARVARALEECDKVHSSQMVMAERVRAALTAQEPSE